MADTDDSSARVDGLSLQPDFLTFDKSSSDKAEARSIKVNSKHEGPESELGNEHLVHNKSNANINSCKRKGRTSGVTAAISE